MKLYLYNAGKHGELVRNGYELVREKDVAGTPSPARLKQLRMRAMLEADAVVFGSQVKGFDLLRLRAACMWSGLRLIALKDLPELAPESYRTLDAVSITDPVSDLSQDVRIGDLSIRELERLKRATEKELNATPVLSDLHHARKRWFRAITERLKSVGAAPAEATGHLN